MDIKKQSSAALIRQLKKINREISQLLLSKANLVAASKQQKQIDNIKKKINQL